MVCGGLEGTVLAGEGEVESCESAEKEARKQNNERKPARQIRIKTLQYQPLENEVRTS
jgi:hypothetical protein